MNRRIIFLLKKIVDEIRFNRFYVFLIVVRKKRVCNEFLWLKKILIKFKLI